MFLTVFLLFIKIGLSQQIKFQEKFDYELSDRLKNHWNMYNEDTSKFFGNCWALTNFEINQFSKRKVVSRDGNPNSQILVTYAGQNANGLNDDWISTKKSYLVTSNDTLIYYAGTKGYTYKPQVVLIGDTVEFWISTKGPSPQEMEVMVDRYGMSDSIPVWRKRSVYLGQFLNGDSKYIWIGIRHHLRDAIMTGSRIWIDDIMVANRESGVGIAGTAAQLQRLGLVQPNPAKGACSISYNSIGLGQASLQISNTLGQELKSYKLEANKQGNLQLSTSDLPPGIYLLNMLSNKQTLSSQRLVVE